MLTLGKLERFENVSYSDLLNFSNVLQKVEPTTKFSYLCFSRYTYLDTQLRYVMYRRAFEDKTKILKCPCNKVLDFFSYDFMQLYSENSVKCFYLNNLMCFNKQIKRKYKIFNLFQKKINKQLKNILGMHPSHILIILYLDLKSISHIF